MPSPIAYPATPPKFMVRSPRTVSFAHLGRVYVYHDLYGYILEMSPDLLDLLNAFRESRLREEVCNEFDDAFEDAAPEPFVMTFFEYACLVDPQANELDLIWPFYPVRAAWTVWERDDDGMTLYTCWGGGDVRKHRFNAVETAIWDECDGETRLEDLAETHGKEQVAAFVERLAHHRVQALKLSRVAASYYEFKGRQHLKPPYLTSTMPYRPYEPEKDELPPAPEQMFSPEEYYRREVADAEKQFDHEETTLSHLFRLPHPALQGRTYGQAIVDGLEKRGLFPGVGDGPLKVLEIGAGLGFVAEAAIGALRQRGYDVEWDIIELSPALAEAQRERTKGLPVTIHEGDVLSIEWPGSDYDVILANEMIGDLPAVHLTHEQTGLDQIKSEFAEEIIADKLSKIGGEVERLIQRYKVPLGDAPDPFFLNIGAWKLVEICAEHLSERGFAMLTEFGQMSMYPVLSRHLDHPEASIHFGHMSLIAQDHGLSFEFTFVMDLIEMEREAEGLATTRSYFRCLASLLAEHGVELRKIGYTRKMFEELCGDKVDLDNVGELRYDRIEDRLMGLVPHEFKALILMKRKPEQPARGMPEL